MLAESSPAPETLPRDRPKVLIIAEAANPEFVSVPLVGWSLASALRPLVDAHIVTQVRNRDALIRAGLVEGTDFTAIDSERIARPLWRLASFLRMGEGKGWTTVQAIASLAYPYFESLVWKQFGKRIRAREYDVVHRITPLSPTVASLLAPKCQKAGVPFVLGPLNGGVPWPREFESERRREREWLSYVRSAYKLLPGPRRTMASSAAIICGSRHTQSEVPAKHRHRSIYLVENAIDPKRFFRLAIPGRSGSPLRVAFLGRMVPYKGPDMLIEAALPLVDGGSVQLEMIGDGPLLPAIREMAASRSGITFHGWLQHEKIQDILVNCDLLALPSVREFGGGVVLEAMALGVPPLVVDYAGPGELVNDDRGFKVPLTSRQALIGALHQQIRQIAENPSQLAAKGDAARSWVLSTATWDSKAGQVVQVYDWVMKRREDKPDFSGLFR